MNTVVVLGSQVLQRRVCFERLETPRATVPTASLEE